MALLRRNYDPAVMQGALDDNIGADLEDVLDTNSNELLEYDEVTSAVNYIRLTNAATTSDPELSTQGDDTNINFQLTPSGTGVVFLGNRGSISTIAAGVVTVNGQRGKIQTGASFLSGSTAVYKFNLVNNKIWPTSVLQLSLANYSAATGFPFVSYYTVGSGSAVIALASGLVASPTSGSVEVHFVVL